jgi:predicted nucleotidyltransferase
MNEINNFITRVAEYFRSRLEPSLVDVYKMGSLAHGGFSAIYSDIDFGVILNCANPPAEMQNLIAAAKELDAEYGKKLSVFWGNPAHSWGRLPVIDRLDLLDHAIPLLNDQKLNFPRPGKDAIHAELRQTIEKSWQPRIPELQALTRLEAKDRKPYVRAILYAARLIYTWDNLLVDSNDRAVEYLKEVKPTGLDLQPIEMALACRQEKCTAEEVFALKTDLGRLADSALNYIFRNATRPALSSWA